MATTVADVVAAPKLRQEEVTPLTRDEAYAILEEAKADDLYAL